MLVGPRDRSIWIRFSCFCTQTTSTWISDTSQHYCCLSCDFYLGKREEKINKISSFNQPWQDPLLELKLDAEAACCYYLWLTRRRQLAFWFWFVMLMFHLEKPPRFKRKKLFFGVYDDKNVQFYSILSLIQKPLSVN